MKIRFQNIAIVVLLIGVSFARVMEPGAAADAAERPAWVQERLWDAKFLASRNQKTEAAAIYRELAEAGDLEAMAGLAECLLTGSGVEKDVAEGERLLTRSAEAGWPESWFILAQTYRNGNDGLSKDRDRAIAYARRAIEEGYPNGYSILSDMAEDPLEEMKFIAEGVKAGSGLCTRFAYFGFNSGLFGFPKDRGNALFCLFRYADLKPVNAYVVVNHFLENEDGGGLDADAVRPYAERIEQAALATGDPEYASSFLALSDLYRKGLVFEANAERADFWLKHALAFGGRYIFTTVGERYLKGETLPFDPEAGIRCLTQAIAFESDNPFPYCSLITFYGKGAGGEPNMDQAYAWCEEGLRNVAKSDQDKLINAVDHLFDDGASEEELAGYRRWRDGMAEMHGGEIVGQTAIDYMVGRRGPQDIHLGLEWHELAYREGDAYACWYLGETFHEGIFVKKDAGQAAKWMLRAHELLESGRSITTTEYWHKRMYPLLAEFHRDGLGVAPDPEKAARFQALAE